THHVEPIAQVILRPNETQIGNLPNEDAQSLVFDENSIFSINKFSGYDRVEGGSRLNYGGRYSFRSNGEFFTSVLFGQSVHLAGRNSFAAFDLANTGRNSGLESSRSDYVTAVTVQPFSNMNFTARGRYDERNLSLRRFDLSATSTLGKVNFSAVYTRISPQPELGYPLRREGLFLQSKVDLPQNFYVAGSVLFDMDRYLSQRAVANTLGQTYSGTQWRVAATTLGLGYRDECTDFSVTYTRANSDYLSLTAAGGQPTNRTTSTILMRLTLRDLIESQFSNRTR
ncbi:MAG: LPS assembly protein LptD, partial [Methylobacterium sp.]|nr:LPS assembly protein LptD [Methylobacterium sp.]